MTKKKKIVVKIGSSLLANEDNLTLRYAFMNGLMSDLAKLQKAGHDIILTSSGSVALGLNMVGKRPEDAGILDKQAAAACGQPLLMNAYRQVASEYELDVAQMLVTVEDMEDRRRFLNIKNTMMKLFENDILPIINENDSVATRDLRVGDNDRLSAKVAQMIQADLLIILTSVDGLYDRNPSDADAKFIAEVEDVTEHRIHHRNFRSGQRRDADQDAGRQHGPERRSRDDHRRRHHRTPHLVPAGRGTPLYPLSGDRRNRVAAENLAEQPLAGFWHACDPQRCGRLRGRGRLWHQPRRRDLDPGRVHQGDVLHMYNESGVEVARGLTNFSSEEIMLLARNLDMPVEAVIGYKTKSDVIGAENILVLDDNHLLLDAPEDDQKLVVPV